MVYFAFLISVKKMAQTSLQGETARKPCKILRHLNNGCIDHTEVSFTLSFFSLFLMKGTVNQWPEPYEGFPSQAFPFITEFLR